MTQTIDKKKHLSCLAAAAVFAMMTFTGQWAFRLVPDSTGGRLRYLLLTFAGIWLMLEGIIFLAGILTGGNSGNPASGYGMKRQTEKKGLPGVIGRICRTIGGHPALFLLVVTLALFLLWLPAFLAMYPGTFGYDATAQMLGYYRINGACVTTHHPLLHTYFLGICMDIGYELLGSYSRGLALNIVLQELLLAFCFARCLLWLRKRKVSGRLVVFSLLFFGLHPIIQILVMNTTKDVLFAGLLLVALMELIDLAGKPETFVFLTFFQIREKGRKNSGKRKASQGNSREGKPTDKDAASVQTLSSAERKAGLMRSLLFLFDMTLMCAMRKQGYILLAFVSFFALILFFRKKIVPFLLILSTVLGWFVMDPLPSMIGIPAGNSREALSVPIQLAAAVYNEQKETDNVMITEEESAKLQELIPAIYLDNMDPVSADNVKAGFQTEVFDADKGDYIRLFLRLGARNPKTYLRAFSRLAYGSIDLGHRYLHRGLMTLYTFEDMDEWHLERRTKFPAYYEYLNHMAYGGLMLNSTRDYILIDGVLGPVWEIYLMLLLVLAAIVYRKKEFFLPLMLLFGQWGIQLLSPVSLMRYTFPFIVCLPVLLCLASCIYNPYKEPGALYTISTWSGLDKIASKGTAMYNVIRKHRNLFFFLYLTLIFLLLYCKFIFGGGIYMYSDTGSDSMSSSYPIVMMIGRMFRNGDLSAYNLQFGLGESAVGMALQYVNPVKLLLLLFGKEHFAVGILIQLYLQTLITGFAGKDFFKQLCKNDDAAFLTGAIWAFTSFITLWSQNYSYGICVMMFTLSIDLFQHVLESRAMGWKLALAGELGLFLFSNYYFYYMTAIMLIIWCLGWSVYNRKGFRIFVQKLFALAFCGIFSALMGLAAVVSNFNTFSSSSRTSAFGGLAADLPLLIKPSLSRLVSILGRFFSADLFGTGIWYHGYANYYEMAMLSTSLLFFFAFFYLVQMKKYRLHQILVWLLALVVTALPLTGRILLGASMTGRYTFFVCLLECVTISFFLTELLGRVDFKKLMRASWITGFVTLGSLAVVLVYCKVKDIDFKKQAVLPLAVSGVLYFGLFAWICYKGKKALGEGTDKAAGAGNAAGMSASSSRHGVWNFREGGLVLTGLILALELVLSNNAGVNDRIYLQKGELGSRYFNNDVEACTDALEQEDSGLYRIYGSTASDYYDELNALNAGMVNGYNSTTARFNTPSSSIVSLADGYDVFQYASTYFAARYEEYPAFTYLAGKYLILNNQEDQWVPDEALFEKKETVGDCTIYENKNALPFGYLYTDEMDYADYNALTTYEKMAANGEAFYYTDEDHVADMVALSTQFMSGMSEATPHDPEVSDYLPAEETDLLQNYKNVVNMAITPSEDGLCFHAGEAWSSVTFDMPALADGDRPEDSVTYFYLVSDKVTEIPQTNARIYYRCGDDDDFHLYNIFWLDTTNILPEGVTQLKMEIQNPGENLALSNLIVGSFPNPDRSFDELRDGSVTDISFSDSTYQASVNCDADTGMLCVPILYNKNWTATVNGKAVKVANINDGFTGIKVGKGENEVKMTYTIPHMKLGILVSCGAIGIYLLMVVVYFVKWRKRRKKKA